MKAKILVIEGTDCSGKETQTKLLKERLEKEGKRVSTISYPIYPSSTGRIVGACLLGKPQMCEDYLKQDHGFFEEGGGEVDPLTALCYYAADRRYSLPLIKKYLEESDYLILDRYTTSNMGHRAGMIQDKEKRLEMYKKIELLEYEILELPRPDKVIFLHLPYELGDEIRKKRAEKLDESESNEHHLRLSEQAYLEMSSLYDFSTVECAKNGKIKSIEEIHEEVYNIIVQN